MKKIFLEPIFQRIFSGFAILLISKNVNIDYLGYYSFLVTILIVGQNISDSSIKSFILTNNNQNIPANNIQNISKIYIYFSSLILTLAVAYLHYRDSIPIYFYFFVLAPFSWLSTQTLHIECMRGSLADKYYATRLSCLLIVNSLTLVSIIYFHSILSLILLQSFIEPSIYLCCRLFIKPKFKYIGGAIHSTAEFQSNLRRFQFLSIANWGIVLFDRLVLGFFLIPKIYGVWTLTTLISKSGIEAFGIGMNTWLRKKLLDKVEQFDSIILIAIRWTLLVSSVAIIAFKFVLIDKIIIYLPILIGSHKLFCLFIISSEIIVLFSILNSENIYNSQLDLNFRWIGLVILTSPIFILLSLKNLLIGVLFSIFRDLLFFYISAKINGNRQNVKIIMIFVSIQIVAVLL